MMDIYIHEPNEMKNKKQYFEGFPLCWLKCCTKSAICSHIILSLSQSFRSLISISSLHLFNMCFSGWYVLPKINSFGWHSVLVLLLLLLLFIFLFSLFVFSVRLLLTCGIPCRLSELNG